MILRSLIYWIIVLSALNLQAQFEVKGKITDRKELIEGASIYLKNQQQGTATGSDGSFSLRSQQLRDTLIVSYLGYKERQVALDFSRSQLIDLGELVLENDNALDEFVILGNLRPTALRHTTAPIEIYQPVFFKNKPVSSLFDAVSTINGVRAQINCSVCNAGDIHINAQEGANTLILIDGMPIVSGLGSVYGLMGIPQALVKSIEVIKGPASLLFGSEATGGVININTISPTNNTTVYAEAFTTNWGELNLDTAFNYNWGSLSGILGINGFTYNQPIDHNNDGFTDLVLQNRMSVFNKISAKNLTFALRYIYENRWGGQLNWQPINRLGEEVYGEQISTKRAELFGDYRLSSTANLQYSYNDHDQDAAYGNLPYLGRQRIAFIQYVANRSINKHDLTFGAGYRYTYYDDNSVATPKADQTHLPGLFIQNDIELSAEHQVLVGLRYDYNSLYGSILTPRLNYKYAAIDNDFSARLSLGSGYRVVNLFTEDHAALTGAREVIIKEAIAPERSWNVSATLNKQFISLENLVLDTSLSFFYSHFDNKIIPDYDSNPNQIIYANLDERAIAKGGYFDISATWTNGVRLNLGATFTDLYIETLQERIRPILAERYSSVYQLSAPINASTEITLSGQINGPMRLPLLSELDPRSPYSPVIHLMHLKVEKRLTNQLRAHMGVRNLLNFLPDANSIARSFDPFDKQVEFDPQGQALPSANNPYALTFDPSYVYASNQGRNFFVGLAFTLN